MAAAATTSSSLVPSAGITTVTPMAGDDCFFLLRLNTISQNTQTRARALVTRNNLRRITARSVRSRENVGNGMESISVTTPDDSPLSLLAHRARRNGNDTALPATFSLYRDDNNTTHSTTRHIHDYVSPYDQLNSRNSFQRVNGPSRRGVPLLPVAAARLVVLPLRSSARCRSTVTCPTVTRRPRRRGTSLAASSSASSLVTHATRNTRDIRIFDRDERANNGRRRIVRRSSVDLTHYRVNTTDSRNLQPSIEHAQSRSLLLSCRSTTMFDLNIRVNSRRACRLLGRDSYSHPSEPRLSVRESQACDSIVTRVK